MSKPEYLKIKKDRANEYSFKSKDGDSVEMEHKDKKLKFKLLKWGKETSLEIILDTVEADTHTFDDDILEVEDSKNKARIYSLNARSTTEFYGDTVDQIQCEDGGLRFEIELKEKPNNNEFDFKMTAQNLAFYYQPPLTDEERERGMIRPLNVECSYAVYHISKKNNSYKTGKAFHIYRPIAEDAIGNKSWCGLSINKEINPTKMTVTVPQQFLDEATYPVVIDPDYGYTTIGATLNPIRNNDGGTTHYRNRYGNELASGMPSGGTVTSVLVYMSATSDRSWKTKAIVSQTDSGGTDVHGQIALDENLNQPIAAAWRTFTMGGETLNNGQRYVLNCLTEGNTRDKSGDAMYTYQDSGSGEHPQWNIINYTTPQNPWSVSQVTTANLSIYMVYTAVSVGWTGIVNGVTNPAAVLGVDVADIDNVSGVA